MKPLAIVIPWYGDNIRGGAEMECNYLAHSLDNAGQSVEVFTTCVKDATSNRWNNTMKAGVYLEDKIKVRRFFVKEANDENEYTNSNSNIYHNKFNEHDEEIYFRDDINSPDMYHFIKENKDKYRAFVFIPYMYGITFNASAECMEKAILIPCLHDESYAYMQILKEKMKNFKGMIFHAKPEEKLAYELYNLLNVKTGVLGEGIDTDWHKTCDANNFRKKFNIHDDFILYAGRKDLGKKVDELAIFLMKYKEDTGNDSLKLVLLGGGELPIQIPKEYKDDVIDLGFVSVEDKHNAFAAATIFCNPSHFESFSLVIMESWLAKRPILVSEHCAVTTNFALETNGGLWYKNYYEFRECVHYLLNHPTECSEMGENGFNYVMNNFTHEKIAQTYLEFIASVGL